MSQPPVTIKRALISVSDKTHIVSLAQTLQHFEVEILSTGNTAVLLRENHIPIIDVANYTDFPEMMGGRLKTLHPRIHGGILGRRDKDAAVMQEFNLPPIDLVVVNLYPFAQTVANPECTHDEAVENIDIGGPTMVRAAAKNHDFVTVLVDPQDYSQIEHEMRANKGQISYQTRLDLAAKAFAFTTRYDQHIAHYFKEYTHSEEELPIEFPDILSLEFFKKEDLRYGENPHQKAALYLEKPILDGTFAKTLLLQGTALSYNNVADADAAYGCVLTFKNHAACVIVKHANPCGVAVATTPSDAYQLAYRCDPTSAFGGIIAFNQEVDTTTAQAICAQQFVEVIIAPGFSKGALEVFAKKPKIRLLSGPLSDAPYYRGMDLKRISGGLLVQQPDVTELELSQLHVVSKKQPQDKELQDLLFAWKVAKFVKSNAIVYAKDLSTIGIGAGQMSRIDSAKIASLKAQHAKLSLLGAVMASDAFFPFADSVELAHQLGISAIIQPGGSIRDAEVIAKADELGIVLIFTHIRHFRH